MTQPTMTMKGRAWTFGDDVLNDGGVVPGEMLRKLVLDPKLLAKGCMVSLNPRFPGESRPGDVIFAGRHFGKGQMHVTGPLAIKGSGVGIVTESMTRGFFRLCVTAGVPMIPFAPGVLALVKDGDPVQVDFTAGRITNLASGRILEVPPLPPFLWEIIDAGGEREWLKRDPAIEMHESPK
jgi:3-isopropylmalate/(R)-2-methylmalate dehydratase small subunit